MEQNNITYSPMGQKSEVYLIGTIVDTPKLMYTGNDKAPMCRFRISIGRKDGKRDIFLCTAWHDTAEEIVEKHKFKEHDIAALSGTLRNHRYVQDKQYKSETQIVVTKVSANFGEVAISQPSQEEIDRVFDGEDVLF